MTAAEKNFMKLTIKSHWLKQYPLQYTASLVPSREDSYFEAKKLARTTDYFERKNILVSDDDFIYPPSESFKKSFDKWLAIQKHDVKTVNSLHEWHEKVNDALHALNNEICELEEMVLSPALQIHIDKVLARKEAEHCELAQLAYDVRNTIDKVKATPYCRKAKVA